jgi:hypothetical protein
VDKFISLTRVGILIFFLGVIYMESDKKEDCYDVNPVVNWKCIWFTFALAGGYWFLPKKNKWILLALLYFPYIMLAFYDHHYDCKRNMGPTYLAMFYHWAKPQESKQIKDYKNWCPEIKSKVLTLDLIILIIAIGVFPYFLRWNPK